MSENKFELIIENSIVIGYEGKANVVEIPEGVTEIGKKAFYNCKFIEEINIKSTTLKTIGESAFEGCAKIKKCKLSSLKGSVEKNAFYGCHALTHIEIPDGAIKIGPNVFGDCNSLLFVVIPSSVFVLDGQIFDADNKRTVILGKENSEAEEYSKSNAMPFKEDTVSIRNEILALEQKKNSVSFKDFTIFGETVRCYQSVVVYQELLDFYKNLGKDFVQNVFDCMPMSIAQYDDDKIGKLIYLANDCTEKTKEFLQQHGIFINDGTFETKVSDFKLNYINVSRTLLDTYMEIQEAISEGKYNLESTLVAEAESKITGLSYGVIGDSLTMVAYALDEYRAEKQQRKAAYAEAAEKMQTGTSRIYNKAQQLFTDFMNETCIPAYEKSIHYIIEGLMEFATEEMLQTGLIDQEIFEIYDATKSRKITEQAKNNSNIDKKYAVAMALKLYPLNIDAITIAVDLFISNNYIEKDVFALAEFLGMNKNDIFSSNYSYIQLYNFYNKNQESLSDKLDSFLAELIDKTANHLICRINDGYDPAELDAETWNSLVENYTVISPENSVLFHISEQDIKGPNGQQLLSNAIQTYNEEMERKEQERKIAEEKRLEKERQEKEEAERLAREQKRIEKEKKKKKIIATLIAIFSLILACIIAFFVIRDIVIPLSIYNNGVELLNNKKYAGAIHTFTKVYETKDAQEKIIEAEIETLKEAKVGDTVLFGHCSQTESFGEETPIEWLVVDFADGKALLLSKYALKMVTIGPDESRSKLNKIMVPTLNDYYESFFSSFEKEYIQPTKSPCYEGMKVFILDDVEIIKYFPEEEFRKLQPTAYCYDAYADSDGLYQFKGYIPWLTIERKDGWYKEIDYMDSSRSFDYFGIRPAIWVSIEREDKGN